MQAVGGEFTGDEGERGVVEGEPVVLGELVLVRVGLLDLLEEVPYPVGDGLTALITLGEGGEFRVVDVEPGVTALLPDQFLVVQLGEQDVEELPERGVLGQALVAVDEVVAAAEGELEHRLVGAFHDAERGDVALGIEEAGVAARPVGKRQVLVLEAVPFAVDEVEVLVIRPHAVLALRPGRVHQVGDLVDLLLGPRERTDLGDGTAVVAGRLDDDDPADVLRPGLRVGLDRAVLEDHNARPLARLAAGLAVLHLEREVGPHVARIDAVLMDQRAGDALPHLLHRGVLDDLVSGDVVEDLVVLELARPRGLLLRLLRAPPAGRLRPRLGRLRRPPSVLPGNVEAQLFLTHRACAHLVPYYRNSPACCHPAAPPKTRPARNRFLTAPRHAFRLRRPCPRRALPPRPWSVGGRPA